MSDLIGASFVILFFGLMAYGIYKISYWITTAVFGLFLINRSYKNTRMTNLHYYDHNDRYFDYDANQWFLKESK